jgi:hypothetical protein
LFTPSPIERVIHFPFAFDRTTTSDFCFGETRQQITLFAVSPKWKNEVAIYSSSRTNANVDSSITIARLSALGFALNQNFHLLIKSVTVSELKITSSMVCSLIKLQDCCFLLVTSKDPYLDVCFHQNFDCFRYFILEQIFNRTRSYIVKTKLKFIIQ